MKHPPTKGDFGHWVTEWPGANSMRGSNVFGHRWTQMDTDEQDGCSTISVEWASANPKSESRNPKQIRNPKDRNAGGAHLHRQPEAPQMAQRRPTVAKRRWRQANQGLLLSTAGLRIKGFLLET